jgi:hypothetical protein
MSEFRVAGEQELVDELRKMENGPSGMDGYYTRLVIKNQQIIARGIAHLIEATGPQFDE